MTNDAGILCNVRPYHGTKFVAVGNGDALPITHTGDGLLPLLIGTSLPLSDVLVVPQLQKNLSSISQHTTEYPCIVNFLLMTFLVRTRRWG
ncbi:MAG: hypothetical protein Q8877_02680 [Sweet potato little leaf phytoplasma]|nr:hypothetical protein [Sweet potato little leaf phytoplasma]